EPVSENYILFGIGGSADSGAFSRYQNGKSINLYDEAGLRRECDRLSLAATGFEKQITSLRQQLAGLKRRERSQRARLQAQVAAAEKELNAARAEKAQLDRSYGNAETRRQLFSDYETLSQLGSKLTGSAFDMASANSRLQLKVRLLSSMRPEAFKVLEEIAASY